MLDTILFDLDGTLLPLDLERFIQIYFSEIGQTFSDLMEPKLIMKHIWDATHTMVSSTDERTNETVFMEKFGQLIDGDLATYQQRFDQFYDQGFLNARASVVDTPVMQAAVRHLKAKGFNLVIATNPLFPEKAIHHRIRWAGFEPTEFSYITSYERNHYCKPQPLFYRELLAEIGKEPNQCLMVGNDVQEDLIAASVGIPTFLIKDYLIHRDETPIRTDFEGSYHDFFNFVNQLPPPVQP